MARRLLRQFGEGAMAHAAAGMGLYTSWECNPHTYAPIPMSTTTIGVAVEAFHRYADAFQRLDASEIPPYFNAPALFVSPQGIVALATAEQVEEFFRQTMHELREQGYVGSEFPQLTEHWLRDDLALVSGVAVWKAADGRELRRFGLTYTMVHANDAWKIVTALIHDEHADIIR